MVLDRLLQLMNIFNKTDAAIFPMQTIFLGTLPSHIELDYMYITFLRRHMFAMRNDTLHVSFSDQITGCI